MEGPGYFVWYETREEAEGWATALEDARNASVRSGADRAPGLAREKGSGRSRTTLGDGRVLLVKGPWCVRPIGEGHQESAVTVVKKHRGSGATDSR